MWIETGIAIMLTQSMDVTPHVGVWIETTMVRRLPSERMVTPHVGVWIETARYSVKKGTLLSHTSCRCVD